MIVLEKSKYKTWKKWNLPIILRFYNLFCGHQNCIGRRPSVLPNLWCIQLQTSNEFSSVIFISDAYRFLRYFLILWGQYESVDLFGRDKWPILKNSLLIRNHCCSLSETIYCVFILRNIDEFTFFTSELNWWHSKFYCRSSIPVWT